MMFNRLYDLDGWVDLSDPALFARLQMVPLNRPQIGVYA